MENFDTRVENNRQAINAKYVQEHVIPNNGLPEVSFLEYARMEYSIIKSNPTPPANSGVSNSLGGITPHTIIQDDPFKDINIIVEDGKVVDVQGLIDKGWMVQYIEKENFKFQIGDIFTFTKDLVKFYAYNNKVDIRYAMLLGKEIEIVDMVNNSVQWREIDGKESIDEIEIKELRSRISIVEIQKNRPH